MSPETRALLIGGAVMLILRAGNIAVKWFAKRLGVDETKVDQAKD